MRYSTYLGANINDARDDTYGVTWIQGAHRSHGPYPVGGFSDDPGRPSIYNSAPYLKTGTSEDEPYLVKIDPSLNGKASLVYSTFLGGGSHVRNERGSFCTSVAVFARYGLCCRGDPFPGHRNTLPPAILLRPPICFRIQMTHYSRPSRGAMTPS